MNKSYEQPLVSIDVVPVRFSEGYIRVALGERIFDPFIGKLALPGVLLSPVESIDDAAYRALESKTGIFRSEVLTLVRIGAFDNPDRDPRGATISIALAAIISHDSSSVLSDWVQPSECESLPFDHSNIIHSALSELDVRLWRDVDITRALVGEEFSTADAIALTESLSHNIVDKTNFTRTLKKDVHIEQTNPVKIGRGRPSAGWKFLA